MRQCRVPEQVQVRVQVHLGLLEVAVQHLLRVSLLPEQAPRCQQEEPHPQPALVLLPALALVQALAPGQAQAPAPAPQPAQAP